MELDQAFGRCRVEQLEAKLSRCICLGSGWAVTSSASGRLAAAMAAIFVPSPSKSGPGVVPHSPPLFLLVRAKGKEESLHQARFGLHDAGLCKTAVPVCYLEYTPTSTVIICSFFTCLLSPHPLLWSFI